MKHIKPQEFDDALTAQMALLETAADSERVAAKVVADGAKAQREAMGSRIESGLSELYAGKVTETTETIPVFKVIDDTTTLKAGEKIQVVHGGEEFSATVVKGGKEVIEVNRAGEVIKINVADAEVGKIVRELVDIRGAAKAVEGVETTKIWKPIENTQALKAGEKVEFHYKNELFTATVVKSGEHFIEVDRAGEAMRISVADARVGKFVEHEIINVFKVIDDTTALKAGEKIQVVHGGEEFSATVVKGGEHFIEVDRAGEVMRIPVADAEVGKIVTETIELTEGVKASEAAVSTAKVAEEVAGYSSRSEIFRDAKPITDVLEQESIPWAISGSGSIADELAIVGRKASDADILISSARWEALDAKLAAMSSDELAALGIKEYRQMRYQPYVSETGVGYNSVAKGSIVLENGKEIDLIAGFSYKVEVNVKQGIVTFLDGEKSAQLITRDGNQYMRMTLTDGSDILVPIEKSSITGDLRVRVFDIDSAGNPTISKFFSKDPKSGRWVMSDEGLRTKYIFEGRPRKLSELEAVVKQRSGVSVAAEEAKIVEGFGPKVEVTFGTGRDKMRLFGEVVHEEEGFIYIDRAGRFVKINKDENTIIRSLGSGKVAGEGRAAKAATQEVDAASVLPEVMHETAIRPAHTPVEEAAKAVGESSGSARVASVEASEAVRVAEAKRLAALEAEGIIDVRVVQQQAREARVTVARKTVDVKMQATLDAQRETANSAWGLRYAKSDGEAVERAIETAELAVDTANKALDTAKFSGSKGAIEEASNVVESANAILKDARAAKTSDEAVGVASKAQRVSNEAVLAAEKSADYVRSPNFVASESEVARVAAQEARQAAVDLKNVKESLAEATRVPKNERADYFYTKINEKTRGVKGVEEGKTAAKVDTLNDIPGLGRDLGREGWHPFINKQWVDAELDPLQKFYFNARGTDEAVELMRDVMVELNARRIPMQMKTASEANFYGHYLDNTVLYVPKSMADDVEKIAAEILSRKPYLVDDAVPMFTKKVRGGLGTAEESIDVALIPDAASSGQRKMKAMEELFEASKSKQLSDAELLKLKEEIFIKHGIDPKQPWKNYVTAEYAEEVNVLRQQAKEARGTAETEAVAVAETAKASVPEIKTAVVREKLKVANPEELVIWEKEVNQLDEFLRTAVPTPKNTKKLGSEVKLKVSKTNGEIIDATASYEVSVIQNAYGQRSLGYTISVKEGRNTIGEYAYSVNKLDDGTESLRVSNVKVDSLYQGGGINSFLFEHMSKFHPQANEVHSLLGADNIKIFIDFLKTNKRASGLDALKQTPAYKLRDRYGWEIYVDDIEEFAKVIRDGGEPHFIPLAATSKTKAISRKIAVEASPRAPANVIPKEISAGAETLKVHDVVPFHDAGETRFIYRTDKGDLLFVNGEAFVLDTHFSSVGFSVRKGKKVYFLEGKTELQRVFQESSERLLQQKGVFRPTAQDDLARELYLKTHGNREVVRVNREVLVEVGSLSDDVAKALEDVPFVLYEYKGANAQIMTANDLKQLSNLNKQLEKSGFSKINGVEYSGRQMTLQEATELIAQEAKRAGAVKPAAVEAPKVVETAAPAARVVETAPSQSKLTISNPNELNQWQQEVNQLDEFLRTSEPLQPKVLGSEVKVKLAKSDGAVVEGTATYKVRVVENAGGSRSLEYQMAIKDGLSDAGQYTYSVTKLDDGREIIHISDVKVPLTYQNGGVNTFFFDHMSKFHPQVDEVNALLRHDNVGAFIDYIKANPKASTIDALKQTPAFKVREGQGWEVSVGNFEELAARVRNGETPSFFPMTAKRKVSVQSGSTSEVARVAEVEAAEASAYAKSLGTGCAGADCLIPKAKKVDASRASIGNQHYARDLDGSWYKLDGVEPDVRVFGQPQRKVADLSDEYIALEAVRSNVDPNFLRATLKSDPVPTVVGKTAQGEHLFHPKSLEDRILGIAESVSESSKLSKEDIKNIMTIKLERDVRLGKISQSEANMQLKYFDGAYQAGVLGADGLVDYVIALQKLDPAYTNVYLLRDGHYMALADKVGSKLGGLSKRNPRLAYVSRDTTVPASQYHKMLDPLFDVDAVAQSNKVATLMEEAQKVSSNLPEFRKAFMDRFNHLMETDAEFYQQAKRVYNQYKEAGLIHDNAKLRFVDSCCQGTIPYLSEGAIEFFAKQEGIQNILLESKMMVSDNFLSLGLKGSEMADDSALVFSKVFSGDTPLLAGSYRNTDQIGELVVIQKLLARKGEIVKEAAKVSEAKAAKAVIKQSRQASAESRAAVHEGRQALDLRTQLREAEAIASGGKRADPDKDLFWAFYDGLYGRKTHSVKGTQEGDMLQKSYALADQVVAEARFNPMQGWVLFESKYGERASGAAQRFYFNARSGDDAIKIMDDVIRELSTRRINFEIKAPFKNNEYVIRTDNTVLYVAKADAEVVEGVVAKIISSKPHLVDKEFPMFTKRIAPGLSTAENPLIKGSFGQIRSDAMVELSKATKGKYLSDAELLKLKKEIFIKHGINPKQPWKNYVPTAEAEHAAKVAETEKLEAVAAQEVARVAEQEVIVARQAQETARIAEAEAKQVEAARVAAQEARQAEAARVAAEEARQAEEVARIAQQEAREAAVAREAARVAEQEAIAARQAQETARIAEAEAKQVETARIAAEEIKQAQEAARIAEVERLEAEAAKAAYESVKVQGATAGKEYETVAAARKSYEQKLRKLEKAEEVMKQKETPILKAEAELSEAEKNLEQVRLNLAQAKSGGVEEQVIRELTWGLNDAEMAVRMKTGKVKDLKSYFNTEKSKVMGASVEADILKSLLNDFKASSETDFFGLVRQQQSKTEAAANAYSKTNTPVTKAAFDTAKAKHVESFRLMADSTPVESILKTKPQLPGFSPKQSDEIYVFLQSVSDVVGSNIRLSREYFLKTVKYGELNTGNSLGLVRELVNVIDIEKSGKFSNPKIWDEAQQFLKAHHDIDIVYPQKGIVLPSGTYQTDRVVHGSGLRENAVVNVNSFGYKVGGVMSNTNKPGVDVAR